MAQAGGVLYVTTGFGEVWALDPASGGTIWQRTFDAPIRAAPTVRDGRVFVVLRSDAGYGLDARTGQTLWRAQGTGGPGLLGGASPAADGQLVVLPFASGEVLGVLARNGLTVWGTAITGGRREYARNSINDVSGDPVIDGVWVYASNQSGRTIRLDSRTGERAWTLAEGSYGPAWPAGNSVFLLSDLGALVRVDAEIGRGAVAGRAAAVLPAGRPLRSRQAVPGDPLLRPDPGRRAAVGGERRRAVAGVRAGGRGVAGAGGAARRGGGAAGGGGRRDVRRDPRRAAAGVSMRR